ncbi:hypothetical protein ACLRAA_05140 [Gallibacterium anatis]|uniref:Uncharacterized protein n=2 Tax=Gallibacterium anatis TaxID=750 RepID=A0AAX3XHW6_9PAST|nr:hypothetical protein [Gallibacterium anatis]WIM80517.1 hypothetical protein QP018_04620 [Gallibacterium anatis]
MMKNLISSVVKEDGYDEFLAKKIEQGKKDIENGHFVTLEQWKLETEQQLQNKATELEQLKREEMLGYA